MAGAFTTWVQGARFITGRSKCLAVAIPLALPAGKNPPARRLFVSPPNVGLDLMRLGGILWPAPQNRTETRRRNNVKKKSNQTWACQLSWRKSQSTSSGFGDANHRRGNGYCDRRRSNRYVLKKNNCRLLSCKRKYTNSVIAKWYVVKVPCQERMRHCIDRETAVVG